MRALRCLYQVAQSLRNDSENCYMKMCITMWLCAGSEKEAEIWTQASGAEILERIDQSDSAPSKKRRKVDSKARSTEPEYLVRILLCSASIWYRWTVST